MLINLSYIDLPDLKTLYSEYALRFAGVKYGLDFKLDYVAGKEVIKRVLRNFSEIHDPESDCNFEVTLPNIGDMESLEFGVIMAETAGKSRLKSRQACAVESAARRSGLPVYIIMTSPVLTLKDNTTCQLYRSNLSIHFYTVDLETFTIGTPLENWFNSSKMQQDQFAASHKSDGLRSLLVYTFGGFYMDLDYVVLQDLSHYKNTLIKKDSTNKVTNNAFSMPAKHPLFLAILNKMANINHHKCWACIGPDLITSVLKRRAGIDSIKGVNEVLDINLVPHLKISGIDWPYSHRLFPEKAKSFREWEQMFEKASAVHFYSHRTWHFTSLDDPRHSAYAVVGPRYCPISYHSVNVPDF